MPKSNIHKEQEGGTNNKEEYMNVIGCYTYKTQRFFLLHCPLIIFSSFTEKQFFPILLCEKIVLFYDICIDK